MFNSFPLNLSVYDVCGAKFGNNYSYIELCALDCQIYNPKGPENCRSPSCTNLIRVCLAARYASRHEAFYVFD